MIWKKQQHVKDVGHRGKVSHACTRRGVHQVSAAECLQCASQAGDNVIAAGHRESDYVLITFYQNFIHYKPVLWNYTLSLIF